MSQSPCPLNPTIAINTSYRSLSPPCRVQFAHDMATGNDAPADTAQPQDQVINPWSVEGGQDSAGNIVAIDYDSLIRHVYQQTANHVAQTN